MTDCPNCKKPLWGLVGICCCETGRTLREAARTSVVEIAETPTPTTEVELPKDLDLGELVKRSILEDYDFCRKLARKLVETPDETEGR